MPLPRASATQWPAAGERNVKATLQYATPTTDSMGGRTEPTWTEFGVWWSKVTVVPFIVSDTQSSLLYQLEGPYRADVVAKFQAGIGLRALVNGLILKVFQVENPQERNRNLVLHCAQAVNVQ
jgi:hypothetical protein